MTDSIARMGDAFRDNLLGDTMPFWARHSPDPKNGGYFTALGRDGTVLDTDKSVWFQGRFAWVLATMYADAHLLEPSIERSRRSEWLSLAKSGIDFLDRHCRDETGRMYFTVTADGHPLRQRRYVFSEMFAVMAMSAYARATDDEGMMWDAWNLFQQTNQRMDAGELPPKVISTTRPCKGLALPMIRIVVAQELRKAMMTRRSRSDGDMESALQSVNVSIDTSIDEIERDFLSEQFEAVLETVGLNGEFLDHYDGRLMNPGHAIEAAWFVLDESRQRGGDERLDRLGLRILDWSWAWGWDATDGGILYFRDVRNLPVQEYWHAMKFWWPQNEAIIATLLAYERTQNEKYLQWHLDVHEWAHRHFADPEYGEWFGYLNRDGSLSSDAKGTMWKGPFHLPRMQLTCWQICDRLAKRAQPPAP